MIVIWIDQQQHQVIIIKLIQKHIANSITVNNKTFLLKDLNKSDSELKLWKKELLKIVLHQNHLLYQNPQPNFLNKLIQIMIGY
jgi:hypothetical protein